MRFVDPSLRPFLARCVVWGASFFPCAAGAAGVLPTEATTEQKKIATAHFGAGKQAIEAQNWERAAMELRASLDVVDSPNSRLELARVLRDSGKPGEAWAEYGRVIENATKLAASEERYARTAEAATNERADVEAKIAFVTITVLSPPVGATLKVGGRTIPPDQWAGPVVVAPGAVDVVLADATGKEIARQTVSASIGQKTAASLDATPPPPPPAPSAKSAPEPSDDDKPGSGSHEADVGVPANGGALRPIAWVGAGVGVAGLATFGVFGLLSNSTYNDLKNACPAANGGCPPDKRSEINTGKTEQVVANVGLVAGLVGAAAAVTFFLISMPSKTPETTSLVVGPAYVGIEGSL